MGGWAERRSENPGISDEYLDVLFTVREAGYLDEYTAEYLHRSGWQIPGQPDAKGFRDWQRQNLRRHRAETRLVGFWGWANKAAHRSP